MGAHSLVQTTAEAIGDELEEVDVGSTMCDVGNKSAQSCAAAANCCARTWSIDWMQAKQALNSELAPFKTPQEHVILVAHAWKDPRKGQAVGQITCRRTNFSTSRPCVGIEQIRNKGARKPIFD